MNIGIVVYSQTGNTMFAANKLKEALIGSGHVVNVEQIRTVGEVKPGVQKVEIANSPAIASYDAVVFGSPVHGFSLSVAMKSYMEQITSLQDKKIALLVTQAFPYPWLGGNRTIAQMRRICQAKGALVAACGVINWAKSRREQTLAKAIDGIGEAFAGYSTAK